MAYKLNRARCPFMRVSTHFRVAIRVSPATAVPGSQSTESQMI